MVATGQKLGKTIFRDLSEIPIRAREQPRRHRLAFEPGDHARAALPRCRRIAGSSMRRGNACVQPSALPGSNIRPLMPASTI